jgi:hypothetical protein
MIHDPYTAHSALQGGEWSLELMCPPSSTNMQGFANTNEPFECALPAQFNNGHLQLPIPNLTSATNTPPDYPALDVPTISLIGSPYYPHRISADDLFQTRTSDLPTDFLAIIFERPRESFFPFSSPILTLSPSPSRPCASLRRNSSTSLQSSNPVDLDYLHEDAFQNVDVGIGMGNRLGDDFDNIDLENLEVGMVVQDVGGRAWEWQRCYCANMACRVFAFRPFEVSEDNWDDY